MTKWFCPFSQSSSILIPVVYAVALLLAILVLTGCTSIRAAELPYVDLDKRTPLPATMDSDVLPLRLAVAAIISPQGTAESYQVLAQYLEEKLSRPVELIQRRTYAEVNKLVADGQVDIAFVCTSAYVDGHERFGMELLVAPEINGETVYYSELIVPISSEAASIADLAGKRFAFTDPMSFSGRVHPTHLLDKLGHQPDNFFSDTFFTYSHDRAIKAVADGVADGAAVDSLVLDYALLRDPNLLGRLKVIDRSQPFGIPPVVVPPDLAPKQKRLLQDTLLSMSQEPSGQVILDELGIDRFVPIDDAAYAEARYLINETGELQ